MNKVTDIFDKLDNVIGNYMSGDCTAEDVAKTAIKVNDYLFKHSHPHACFIPENTGQPKPNNIKDEVKFYYSNLQTQSGYIKINNQYSGSFETLEVVGNSVVVYGSDNGFSKKGRIMFVFNLDKYEISFRQATNVDN